MAHASQTSREENEEKGPIKFDENFTMNYMCTVVRTLARLRMKNIQFSRFAFFIWQGLRFIAKCAVLTGDSQLYFMLLQQVWAHLDTTREMVWNSVNLWRSHSMRDHREDGLLQQPRCVGLWRTSLVPTTALTSSLSCRNVEWET